MALWLSKLPLSEGLENLVLKAFYLLVANEPDVVSQITSQPWVQDEIDEKEMAFMVALLGEASSSTYGNYALFEALLEGHYTQSKTVSLPVTGDVNIWVFPIRPVLIRRRCCDSHRRNCTYHRRVCRIAPTDHRYHCVDRMGVRRGTRLRGDGFPPPETVITIESIQMAGKYDS